MTDIFIVQIRGDDFVDKINWLISNPIKCFSSIEKAYDFAMEMYTDYSQKQDYNLDIHCLYDVTFNTTDMCIFAHSDITDTSINILRKQIF